MGAKENFEKEIKNLEQNLVQENHTKKFKNAKQSDIPDDWFKKYSDELNEYASKSDSIKAPILNTNFKQNLKSGTKKSELVNLIKSHANDLKGEVDYGNLRVGGIFPQLPGSGVYGK